MIFNNVYGNGIFVFLFYYSLLCGSECFDMVPWWFSAWCLYAVLQHPHGLLSSAITLLSIFKPVVFFMTYELLLDVITAFEWYQHVCVMQSHSILSVGKRVVLIIGSTVYSTLVPPWTPHTVILPSSSVVYQYLLNELTGSPIVCCVDFFSDTMNQGYLQMFLLIESRFIPLSGIDVGFVRNSSTKSSSRMS